MSEATAPDTALKLIERLLAENKKLQADNAALETHIKKLEYWLGPVMTGPKWPEEGGA